MAVSKEQLLDAIKEHLGVEELDRDVKIASLGLDSLDVAECLVDLENDYNIYFEGEETKSLKTIGDLIDLIEAKIK